MWLQKSGKHPCALAGVSYKTSERIQFHDPVDIHLKCEGFAMQHCDDAQVVSEINTFLVGSKEVKPFLGSSNRVANLSFTLPSEPGAITSEKVAEVQVDEDGDLEVRRKSTAGNTIERSLLIEYQNSTALNAVGLQIWRGAFLLSDFVIENQNNFKSKVVLELGAGTGLASVVASMFARKVVATDLDAHQILELIRCNFKHNSNFVKADVEVVPLDFTNLEWSESLQEAINDADVFLVADVVYDDRLTDAFVRTLKKILSTGTKRKDILIAMEKRYVFTIEDVDTVAPMYVHFLEELESRLNLKPSGIGKDSLWVPLPNTTNPNAKYISIKQLPLDFPQHFNYEKSKELVLWQVSSASTIS